MKKQNILIAILAITLVFTVGSVLAQDTRVRGDANLVWQNYGSQPQHFSGSVSGDLTGTLDLIATVDYDSENPTIGNTFADLTATINGVDCQGSATLSNVNSGTDKGYFYLICGDFSVDGNLYGKNAQDENGDWTLFNIKYDAKMSNTTQIPGPQGIQGEQGLPGKDGIDGANGLNGVDGKDGLPGKDGINGQDGAIGPQGPKGDQGEQGIQGLKGDTGERGIQGIPGPKGDTGLIGPQGQPGTPCDNSRLVVLEDFKTQVLAYPGFSDFVAWLNSQDRCTNNQLRCSGNNAQKCVNYVWVTQSACQYGCENGNCKPAPFVCTSGTKQCSGSIPQTCVNNAWVNGADCGSLGCLNGVCNQPVPIKEDCTKIKYTCNGRYSIGTSNIGCQAGQGTLTSCNLGKCIPNSRPIMVYCGRGCNTSTGRCL